MEVKSKRRWFFFLKWTSCTSQFLLIKSSVWWSSPNSFCERSIKTLDQPPSLSLCWHECWSSLLSHVKRILWVLSRSLPSSVQCKLLWTIYFEQICAMNTFFNKLKGDCYFVSHFLTWFSLCVPSITSVTKPELIWGFFIGFIAQMRAE